MLVVLAQLRATGANSLLALVVIGVSLLILAMSVAIAVILLRGYRRDPRNTGQAQLAAGLVLLTSVPEVLRVGLPTVTGVGIVGRSLLVSGCELVGLAVILWTVFGGNS